MTKHDSEDQSSENTMTEHNSEDESSNDKQVIEGEVISTRTLPHQDSEFQRSVENTLEFRGLEGGKYKLVKVGE